MPETILFHGDLFDVLPTLPAESAHACVCDPPYLLGFMGKEFDEQGGKHLDPSGMQTWHERWAREIYRLLKPGGYLVAFGGTRTFHRLTCGIEDAGFEIRDCLSWLYGSGFPKSLDVAKAIDKAARGVPQGRSDPTSVNHGKFKGGRSMGAGPGQFMAETGADDVLRDDCVAEAQEWNGWGTALKPAWEPIILARKPLSGTVAANILAHGTGALNIDGCRTAVNPAVDDPRLGGKGDWASDKMAKNVYEGGYAGDRVGSSPLGRWPTNVVLDEEAARQLDEQNGDHASGQPGDSVARASRSVNAFGVYGEVPLTGYGDTGGVSRFFYCAKSSREERDLGCEHLPPLSAGEATDREDGTDGLKSPRAGAGRTGGARNGHPTVKPVALMRWLVRLVTPPGGTVLDPFTGSGTTGMACRYELFDFIGVEREADYVTIANARIAAAAPLLAMMDDSTTTTDTDDSQPGLFDAL